MTAVILWKEYRQQRGVWLLFSFLAIFAVVVIYGILRPEDVRNALADERPEILTSLLILFMATQGVISGALLLAEEKETGTSAFLDHLSGNRSRLFLQKLLAGLSIILCQSILLILITLGVGIGSWRSALAILGAGMDGLAWGLLAGVLFRTGLTAILLGLVLAFVAWPVCAVLTWIPKLAFNLDDTTSNMTAAAIGTRALMSLGAIYSSWHFYCRGEFSRQPSGLGRLSRFFSASPSAGQALLWLVMRQGRWILAIAVPCFLLSGLAVKLSPYIVWPVGTMLAGMIFGLACFAPDQPDALRFLAAQRFPPGKIWTIKVLFWFAALAVLAGLGCFFALRSNEQWFFSLSERSDSALGYLHGIGLGNSLLLLFIWPIYGFGFGLFCGQLASRPIVGFFLTLMLAPAFALFWAPSLLMGGVPIWWVLSIPIILVVTSRLLMRPWLAGRLMTTQAFGTLVAVLPMIALSMCGFLWYRTVQIPDVEPFDVPTFTKQLDAAKKNEAGQLLRQARLELQRHGKLVDKELWPNRPDSVTATTWRTDPASTLFENPVTVTMDGWPKDNKELERWMDRLLEGEWATLVERAAHMPLGLVQDPRSVPPKDAMWNLSHEYERMGNLPRYRAMQLLARGDLPGALKQLETSLALSRQLRNFAPIPNFYAGYHIQRFALPEFQNWLTRTGPDPQLLRMGLDMLQKHEAAIPDPANTIKGEYLICKNPEPEFLRLHYPPADLFRLAYRTPWEKIRQERLIRAIAADRLLRMKEVSTGEPYQRSFPYDEAYAYPLALYGSVGVFFDPSLVVVHGKLELRVVQLITAIAIYQAEHGKPPATLNELVPNYLPDLPVNPFDGKVFSYRISEGERVSNRNETLFSLAKGQAVIAAQTRSWRLDLPTDIRHWPVPTWNKESQP